MKTVNAKIFALKYWLAKKLKTSLEADKTAMKNGAKITFNDYCKIQIVDCTKSTLDKTKVQKLCDKYGIDITTLEKATNYQRIDIDNIPTEVEEKVTNMLNTLENDNDKVVTKVASAVANIK